MATNNGVNTTLSGQTGTGAFMGTVSPTMVTPVLDTPPSGNLSNCTGTGGLRSFQILTSGTAATYTKPSNVTSILVEMVGGGGGGGGISITTSQYSGASAGGAGAFCRKFYSSASSTYTYTVGALGAGGTAGANNGTDGGDTTFDSMTAPGGKAGKGDASSTTAHVSDVHGQQSIATGGDLNLTGDCGGCGYTMAAGGVVGGLGGLSFWGGNGNQAKATTSQSITPPNSSYGGGGGGAAGFDTTTNAAGADGGTGLIVVWEFA